MTNPQSQKLATTEVLSGLRLEAYYKAAQKFGGLITVTEVARAGDAIAVDASEVNVGMRGGNRRDRGTLLGVNLDLSLATDAEIIVVPEDHFGVVVERPEQLPNSDDNSHPFEMRGFYELSNAVYERLRASTGAAK